MASSPDCQLRTEIRMPFNGTSSSNEYEYEWMRCVCVFISWLVANATEPVSSVFFSIDRNVFQLRAVEREITFIEIRRILCDITVFARQWQMIGQWTVELYTPVCHWHEQRFFSLNLQQQEKKARWSEC